MAKYDVAGVRREGGKHTILGIWVLAALMFSSRSGFSDLGFGPAAPLDPNASSDEGAWDTDPVIATDGSGIWAAVWDGDDFGGTDIDVSRSTDDGETWSSPQAVDMYEGEDMEDGQTPDLATDGSGVWVIVWMSEDDLGLGIGNSDADVFFCRSTDDGVTWTEAAILNTNALTDTGHDSYPHVASDGAGTWIAVWDSGENLGGTAGTDMDIFFARSTDNGSSWSPPALLHSYAESDPRVDEVPRLATDRDGRWVAIWRAWGDDADIYFSRSEDNGTTWSLPTYVDSNAESDDASDDYPDVATDGSGSWVAIWQFRDPEGATGPDYDLFASRSTDDGVSWSVPVVVNSTAWSDTVNDGYPGLATDGLGNWVAIWQHFDIPFGGGGGTKEVFVSRSKDIGLTWCSPESRNSDTVAVNESPGTAIETDRTGRWIAVWNSDDNIGGTIGTDQDILFSVSVNLGDPSVVEGDQWTFYR